MTSYGNTNFFKRVGVLIVVLGALLGAATARAHGPGEAEGYISTSHGIKPHLTGVTIKVIDGDEKLLLRNGTRMTLVVLGYQGEPYLRFSSDGVYRNGNSPATYLNQDRYANVKLPKSANAKAAPKWVKVGTGNSFQWHDHRIHWMSTIPPGPIKATPDVAHHIFDWRVPFLADGQEYAVVGTLDYEPPDDDADGGGGTSSLVWILVAVAAAAIGAGTVLVLRRRRRRTVAP
jgi:hypothetical protein